MKILAATAVGVVALLGAAASFVPADELQQPKPAFAIYFNSEVRGALEPCG